MKGYIKIRRKVLDILHNNLSEDLYYHGVHHTLDALKTCDLYLRNIKIGPHEAKLLRLAILFHDIGFTESRVDHELKSVEIAQRILNEYDIADKDIQIISELIMATEVGYQPKNLLEKLIRDIDLDYLGRSDYYEISDQLYRELQVYSEIQSQNDWNKLQVKFLEAHTYHTEYAIRNRQPNKESRIKELKKMIQD